MRISDVVQEAQWSAPGGHSAGRYPQHGKVNSTDKGLPVKKPQGLEPIEDPESDYGDTVDTIGQSFSSDEPDMERSLFSSDVSRWLDGHKKLFSRDEWYTLKMRMDDATYEDVAASLNITKERVRTLEAHAMRKLRKDPEFNAAFNPRNEGYQEEDIVDEEPASRALCTSGKSDSALGASQLASCKSQGYRSRDGGKSHKVGSERVKVRGKKIKGKKYGGPLPDWS